MIMLPFFILVLNLVKKAFIEDDHCVFPDFLFFLKEI